MLLGSLALLYFEITHPGMLLPGVVGAMGLIIAFIALDKLNVEWGGLALIILGIAMLIAEMFVPSFGALGVGGIVSFVVGSVFLFDPVKSFGYRLPLTLILPTAILFGGIFLTVGYLVIRSTGIKRKGGFEDLMGVAGRVITLDDSEAGRTGMVELRGELWKFESPSAKQVGDEVFVSGHSGLVLIVSQKKES